MQFVIETERETDGRWIADVTDIPGAMAYGETREEAIERAQAVALQAIADHIEHGENIDGSPISVPGELLALSFVTA